MIMVDTIQKALRPLQMASFLFGLEIFRGPSNQPRRYLSALYMFTMWFVYTFLIYYVVSTLSNGRVVIHFLPYFMVILNLSVVFMSIAIVICAHKVYLLFRSFQ